MLIPMVDLLKRAKKEGYGVAAPNVQGEDTVRACIQVAEELNAPMVIDLNYFVHADNFVEFCQKTVDLINASRIPMAFNLDHGRNFDELMWAIRGGMSSMMIDRSMASYEENVAATKEAVKMAHPLGMSVEAELGHVGVALNYEVDGYTNLTDPAEAKKFIEETGVDCLAVAVGNAHGPYRGRIPEFRFELMKQLSEACGDTPLVMHGSSGSGDENLKGAVACGVTKYNICNDLLTNARVVLLDAINNDKIKSPYDYHKYFIQGYKDALTHCVKILGGEGKAW